MAVTWLSDRTAVQGFWVPINNINILEYDLVGLTGVSEDLLLASAATEAREGGILWVNIPEDRSLITRPYYYPLVYLPLMERKDIAAHVERPPMQGY